MDRYCAYCGEPIYQNLRFIGNECFHDCCIVDYNRDMDAAWADLYDDELYPEDNYNGHYIGDYDVDGALDF